MFQETSRKQYLPLCVSCEGRTSLFKCWRGVTSSFQPPWRCFAARAGLFKCLENLERSFHRWWGPLRLVEACLLARKDRFICRGSAVKDVQACWRACWCSVRLVQACLCAWKVWHCRFNHSIRPVKLVQACLSVRKKLESRFHHCGSPVKHLQTSLRARKDLESWFHHCGSPVRLVQDYFMCQQRSRKQFSPLCSSCEARTSLFKCGNGVTSPF